MSALYSARALSSAPDILAELAAQRTADVPTAFQSVSWLKPIYEGLAPVLDATPIAIDIRDMRTAERAAFMPLIVRQEGSLRVASFPDLGVSDYCAPILGSAAPAESRSAEAFWSAVKGALDADMVRLTSMPRTIGAKVNPLALISGAAVSRHSANLFTLSGTVEEFLRERGKKYRKEVERCIRLLTKEGEPQFSRAEAAHEIASSYLVLQTQQLARHQAKGSDYGLNNPAYSAFYEQVLRDGVPQDFAHIFKLSAGDGIVATLMGVTHAGTFTLLRISTGGTRWQHLSPGRLIVIEAMKYFVARGVRTFDMGIGDYAFKRGFGIEPVPLVDVVAPLTWRGVPHAVLHHTKSRARQSSRLRALRDRLRSRAK